MFTESREETRLQPVFVLTFSRSVNTHCWRKRTGCTPGACISWLDYPVLMTMTDIVFELEILLFVQSSSPSFSSSTSTFFCKYDEVLRSMQTPSGFLPFSLSCDLMQSSNNFGRMGVSARNLQSIVKIVPSNSLFRPKRFP